jgi:hypothetical protein
MNFMGMGLLEMGVILLVAFLVLGPSKTIETARTVGKVMRDLRRTFADITAAVDLEPKSPPAGCSPSPRGGGAKSPPDGRSAPPRGDAESPPDGRLPSSGGDAEGPPHGSLPSPPPDPEEDPASGDRK